jgi:hypothetical protein
MAPQTPSTTTTSPTEVAPGSIILRIDDFQPRIPLEAWSSADLSVSRRECVVAAIDLVRAAQRVVDLIPENLDGDSHGDLTGPLVKHLGQCWRHVASLATCCGEELHTFTRLPHNMPVERASLRLQSVKPSVWQSDKGSYGFAKLGMSLMASAAITASLATAYALAQTIGPIQTRRDGAFSLVCDLVAMQPVGVSLQYILETHMWNGEAAERPPPQVGFTA